LLFSCCCCCFLCSSLLPVLLTSPWRISLTSKSHGLWQTCSVSQMVYCLIRVAARAQIVLFLSRAAPCWCHGLLCSYLARMLIGVRAVQKRSFLTSPAPEYVPLRISQWPTILLCSGVLYTITKIDLWSILEHSGSSENFPDLPLSYETSSSGHPCSLNTCSKAIIST
jgi:hypothetical protein